MVDKLAGQTIGSDFMAGRVFCGVERRRGCDGEYA